MAWFLRFTRFGDVHLVYGQERGMSCGPSSVVMCVAKINKLSAAKAAVPEADVRSLYAQQENAGVAPANQKPHDFNRRGTNGPGLAAVLNSLSCGTWTSVQTSSSATLSKIIIQKVGVTPVSPGKIMPIVSVNPVIVGVKWGAGGGHAVVIDTIRSFGGKLYATVCDPWDANVHIQEISASTPFAYKPRPLQHLDLWGETQHERVVKGVLQQKQMMHFDYSKKVKGSELILVHRV